MAESIDSLCQKAREAVASSQYEAARKIYLQALGLRSDVPDVHFGLATVCFVLNDLPSAAYHFKEVTRLDPLRAGAYINLGAVYNRMEQFDDAIPVLRRGIQLDNRRAEGYYNLGLVYRRKNQMDLAIQAYREATRINPRMPDAHYNLANLYLEQEQYKFAVNHYQESLQLRPNWEKAEIGLAQAEAGLSGTEEDFAAADSAERAALSSTVTPPPPSTLSADRTIDPNVHGNILSSLHKATIDSEQHGRNFLRLVEDEIEPAIKELSTALLYPNTSATELDHCLQKFEAAITNVRNAHEQLQTTMERVRVLGEKLLQT